MKSVQGIEPLDSDQTSSLQATQHVDGYPRINNEVLLKNKFITTRESSDVRETSAPTKPTDDTLPVYDWELADIFTPLSQTVGQMQTIAPK